MKSHDSHVRGSTIEGGPFFSSPSESILVYDYPDYNEMLLMAVNLASLKPSVHILTVTVDNGGLPTVKFTVSCD